MLILFDLDRFSQGDLDRYKFELSKISYYEWRFELQRFECTFKLEKNLAFKNLPFSLLYTNTLSYVFGKTIINGWISTWCMDGVDSRIPLSYK